MAVPKTDKKVTADIKKLAKDQAADNKYAAKKKNTTKRKGK